MVKVAADSTIDRIWLVLGGLGTTEVAEDPGMNGYRDVERARLPARLALVVRRC